MPEEPNRVALSCHLDLTGWKAEERALPVFCGAPKVGLPKNGAGTVKLAGVALLVLGVELPAVVELGFVRLAGAAFTVNAMGATRFCNDGVAKFGSP